MLSRPDPESEGELLKISVSVAVGGMVDWQHADRRALLPRHGLMGVCVPVQPGTKGHLHAVAYKMVQVGEMVSVEQLSLLPYRPEWIAVALGCIGPLLTLSPVGTARATRRARRRREIRRSSISGMRATRSGLDLSRWSTAWTQDSGKARLLLPERSVVNAGLLWLSTTRMTMTSVST